MWTAATPLPKIDLFLCISVLEHIDEPRPLIENLCSAALRHNAALFISVPFLDRDKWHFIEDPDPAVPGTPFFDNDVHVMHFSSQGLAMAMRDFGLDNTQFVKAFLWHGLLWVPPSGEAPDLHKTSA
jgi:hypothetical protein